MAKLKDLSDNGVKMYGNLKAFVNEGLNQAQAYAYIEPLETEMLNNGMLSAKYDRQTFNQDWALVKAEQKNIQAIQNLEVTDVLQASQFSEGLGTFREGQYQVQLQIKGIDNQTSQEKTYYITYASDMPLTKEDYIDVGFNTPYVKTSLGITISEVNIVGAYKSA